MASAQLCTGSIGEPAVVIDFGIRMPVTNALPQVPPPYKFTIADCPKEGFYSLTNSSFQCFNNLWQVLPFDHTTNDVAGNFLLINALSGPTTIYIDTIRGLCGGHAFQVDAWVANIVNSRVCGDAASAPNLTFSIFSLTGVLLATYTSGNILANSPAGWTNQKFQFNLSSGNSDVILKIVDNASSGCGNSFAIDDITFSPCAGSIAVTFPGTRVQQIDVCEEGQPNYLLTASYTGFTNPVGQWQISYDGDNFADIPGEVNNTFLRVPTPSGIYSYRFSLLDNGSAASKFHSNPVTIEAIKSPYAQGVNYVFGCYGSTVFLGAAGGSVYHWTGPNSFTSDLQNPSIPSVTLSAAGKYIVKVTTTLGCIGYDSTQLTIYTGPKASLSFSADHICEGQSVQLNATPLLHYRWFPIKGLSNDTIVNPVASPLKTTTYTVKVYNETATCYDTASASIFVWSKPKAYAGADQLTYDQKPVVLQGNAFGSNISYAWSPSDYLNDPFAIKTQSNPLRTITYKLTVTSNVGCGTDTDAVIVRVIDSVLIPTAFSPNNDGLNDTWKIITIGKYPDATVDVYSRWGQLVYSTTGSNYKPWDGNFAGEPALPGSYLYFVRLKKNAAMIKGMLSIIR